MLPKSLSIFLKALFYALILLIPVGARHLFSGAGLYFYVSDAALVATIAVFFFAYRGIFWRRPMALVLFFLFSGASVFFASDKLISAWLLATLLVLGLGAFVVAKMIRAGTISERGLFASIALSSVLQSFIGFIQFWKQSSVGLGIFGEPVLGSEIPGVAKIIISGSKIVRAYGTLPHPNALAAFLVLGLFSLYYLWLKRPSPWKIFSSFRTLGSDALIGVGIFIVSLGLILTFSRTGWLIAAILTAPAIIAALFSKEFFRQAVRLIILISAIALILNGSLGEYIWPRAQFSFAEPAASLRLVYNRVGLDIIAANPLGVGLGNQVIYAERSGEYQKFGLTEDWQYQPIHNIYILTASEIGLLGLLCFLFFVVGLFLRPPFFSMAKLMLLSLLLFGLLDHFLWTAEPGRLMLWLVIGIVIGVSGDRIERARS